ncbi:uncharacterized protein LOC128998980 [Macrosteles quadrilineatus]|uniref:uncharacterized protein LOC128998980 n=1 Tax=Macrosteles quadrilineatus TaxID=74068 RepID=UPI0023E2F212|nr:uncharacterized protein LOC128998980 [Macrosteles quadrilineatus]
MHWYVDQGGLIQADPSRSAYISTLGAMHWIASTTRTNTLVVLTSKFRIPETSGENVYYVLKKLAAAIDIDFNREDVSIAHRLRLFSEKHTFPPIIVQFVSRSIKEKWLSAARRRRNLNTTDISPNLTPNNVYVNEHLTAHNKRLLGQARAMQRDGAIHFAGYFNGKILIKLGEKDEAVRIWCKEDLDKYKKCKEDLDKYKK